MAKAKAKTKTTDKTPDALLERCNATIEKYATRDGDLDKLEDYYYQQGAHAPTGEAAEGIETVRLPYASNAIDLVQDLLGQADLTITVPALSETQSSKRLADSAEAYLRAAMKQSERFQKQDLMGRAAWLVGMRGQLAGRVLALPEWLKQDKAPTGETSYANGPRLPILLQLRDPRYVYPEFGVDGLAYVVEKRTRTVLDLREMLNDPELLPDNAETDEVAWLEYWDKTVYCYWADDTPVSRQGKPAGPWPHLYGGCPYTYEFARQTGRLEPDKRARPLLKSAAPVIDKLELLDSAEATFIAQYNGDALVVYSLEDDFVMDTRPGAVNYLRPDERAEWLRASRRPIETEQAHAKYSAQLDRATFPGSMYGIDPGRVISGFAISQLNQSGQARLAPMIGCIERTLSSLLENVLMIAENYLQPLVSGPLEFYTLTETTDEAGTKYQARKQQKLDAAKLGGVYNVEVSLSELMPADEQANVVLAGRVRQADKDGRPLLSWETAVDKFKLTGSPAEERDRIDREAAWNDPEVAALRRALFVAQVKTELAEELAELGINVDEVLAQSQAPAIPQNPQYPTNPQNPQQPGMPPGMPGSLLPAELQGKLAPQPMGAPLPGEEAPPFMEPPGPPMGGVY